MRGVAAGQARLARLALLVLALVGPALVGLALVGPALLVPAWLVAGAALADPVLEVGLRAGDHPGFGRLVFDLPPPVLATVEQSPASVTVRVSAPGAPVRFAALPPSPRNAGTIDLVDGGVRIAVPPGVVVRVSRPPGRIVFDWLLAVAPPATVVAPTVPTRRPAARPGRGATPTDPLAQGQQIAGVAQDQDLPGRERRGHAISDPPAMASAPEPSPAVPNPIETRVLGAPGEIMPPAPTAMPAAGPAAAAPAETVPVTALLPVDARAGLAAMARGDVALLVVDAAGPADPRAWRTLPGLADATVENLPGATLVSFKLPAHGSGPGMIPMLAHGPAGWTLAFSTVPPEAAPMPLHSEPLHLSLVTAGASRVVSVADPLGGGTLLVGTLAADAAPTRIELPRDLPAFALLPTWRGAAVEPLSDSLDMRAVASGFLLDLGPQRAAFGPPSEGGAGGFSAAGFDRLFDLPQMPTASLINRQEAAAGAVAAAAPRGRGAAQLQLAQAMVALGLGAEAQAVLRLATAADGRLAADPRALALSGVAALLAERPLESGGLDQPVVRDATSGVDEIALWRALREAILAKQSGEPAPADAARTIAARQAIALSYPTTLRERVLPLMAETLAEGGQTQAAQRLIAASEQPAGSTEPGLDYARALLDLAAGRIDAALTRLDRLAASPDRSERARAAVRAVDARLAAGRIDAAQAADAMDRLIAAWRGDGRELRVRMRVAELRVQAGQFRAALAVLRDTNAPVNAAQWSDAGRAAVRDRMAAVFAQTLARDDAAPIEPLSFVSLIEDNADLLPSGPEGERVAARVAERLAALDLPERAEVALHKLVDGAPKGAARGALGATLAAIQVQEGDPQGALLTLSSSTADNLPANVVAARTLTFARATALHGDTDAAIGALAALATAPADALRVELLEKAARWPEAVAVLAQRVARDIVPDGPIAPDGASLLLRLATAAVQAAQADVLEQLRTVYLPRLPPGEAADMLRVLTESPVRGVADLPRAAQEAALARSVVR